MNKIKVMYNEKKPQTNLSSASTRTQINKTKVHTINYNI